MIPVRTTVVLASLALMTSWKSFSRQSHRRTMSPRSPSVGARRIDDVADTGIQRDRDERRGRRSVTWTATGGSFANPTTTSAAFSSEVAGTFTITATRASRTTPNPPRPRSRDAPRGRFHAALRRAAHRADRQEFA